METDAALELIAITRRRAAARGITATVAVHDSAGHPVALARGGKWHGPYMAMGKARLAAAFQRSTAELLEEWADRPLFAQSLTEVLPGGVTLNPGGYPVVINGRCIGAIGVGGSTPDNDHRLAEEAVLEFLESSQVTLTSAPTLAPPSPDHG